MRKNSEKLKKEVREQNRFLRLLLRSFDDIKNGRIKDFDFSK